MFVLANVVDDAEMGITHVIRGKEHLPNTPKQQLLWQALGHTPPVWAHAPVLVNDRRQKLSKRRDKVAIESYRDEGFLPEAMVNYPMLLPGADHEIMPFDQMVPLFDLADVNSSPAFFDEKKQRAFNGEYIRALDTAEFVKRCTPYLRAENVPWPTDAYDAAVFAQIAPLAQSRVSVLGEIVAYADFLFLEQPVRDEKSWAKAMKPDTARPVLADTLDRFSEAALVWEAAALKTAVEEVGAAHGLKPGKAQAPVRVAVTGRTVGLPLFESLELLGRDRTLRRIQAALDRLNT
ncbi:glutamyl/glutaminyl-tRNA synthetase [Thermobifida halotolerans]